MLFARLWIHHCPGSLLQAKRTRAYSSPPITITAASELRRDGRRLAAAGCQQLLRVPAGPGVLAVGQQRPVGIRNRRVQGHTGQEQPILAERVLRRMQVLHVSARVMRASSQQLTSYDDARAVI